jgi:hypothetical protein
VAQALSFTAPAVRTAPMHSQYAMIAPSCTSLSPLLQHAVQPPGRAAMQPLTLGLMRDLEDAVSGVW